MLLTKDTKKDTSDYLSYGKYQGDWANTEIQLKYEKIKFHDLFNRSMEIVFQ